MGDLIGVYKFEYEKKDGSVWKTGIGAYNMEEARDQLFRTVGVVKITSQGFEGRLDAVSDRLKKAIIDSSMPKKKAVGRPPKDK